MDEQKNEVNAPRRRRRAAAQEKAFEEFNVAQQQESQQAAKPVDARPVFEVERNQAPMHDWQDDDEDFDDDEPVMPERRSKNPTRGR